MKRTQIIYLYIKSYEVWEKQGLELSSDYGVEYNAELDSLSIVIKEKHPKLYGDHITDIQLLVGENGSGKSTLIRFLEAGYQMDKDWFVIYATDTGTVGENLTITIYGYGDHYDLTKAACTSNRDDSTNGKSYKYTYSSIGLDRNGLLLRWKVEETIHYPKCGKDEFAYLVFHQQPKKAWYREGGVYNNTDIFPKRRRLEGLRSSQIIDYVKKLQNETDAKTDKKFLYVVPGEIIVLISYDRTYYMKSSNAEDFENLKKKIENKANKGVSSLSSKEKYLFFSFLNLMERCAVLENNTGVFGVYQEFGGILDSLFKANSTPNIKLSEIPYDILKIFYTKKNEATDIECLETLFEILDKSIDEECFRYDDTIYERMKKSKNTKILNNLLDLIDIKKETSVVSIAIHEQYSIVFENMSYGEVALLHLLAAIHSGIEKCSNDISSFIILLDEPDDGFHPEWSRRLINYLVCVLNNKPLCDNERNFQLIITTHSPFLLSDVPKSNIHCIELDHTTGKRRIATSEYGFMGNINNMLKSSFFMESLFGEYAKAYTSDLIADISDLDKWCDQQETNFATLNEREEVLDQKTLELKELELKASMISEEMIRNPMLRKLREIHLKLCDFQSDEKADKIRELMKQIYEIEEGNI